MKKRDGKIALVAAATSCVISVMSAQPVAADTQLQFATLGSAAYLRTALLGAATPAQKKGASDQDRQQDKTHQGGCGGGEDQAQPKDKTSSGNCGQGTCGGGGNTK